MNNNIHIEINNTCKPIICFDLYGNAYLDTGLEQIYQICVNGKNEPFLDKGVYKIINNTDSSMKLSKNYKCVKGANTLLEKSKTSLIEEADGEIDVSTVHLELFPEDYDYCVDDTIKDESSENELSDNDVQDNTFLDEDIEKNYGSHNKKFMFKNIGLGNKNIPIENREFGDVCALYDTFIYDGDKLIFISCDSVYDSVYRMQICTSGLIKFRPIGNQDKIYKIIVDGSGDLQLHLL